MTEQTQLTETSEQLHDALASTIQTALGMADPIMVEALHTGGGIMVCAVDLSQDGRFMGKQLWLTREEGWLLGFYDFAADEADEGVCVGLLVTDPDNPWQVAAQVAAILTRLGVEFPV